MERGGVRKKVEKPNKGSWRRAAGNPQHHKMRQPGSILAAGVRWMRPQKRSTACALLVLLDLSAGVYHALVPDVRRDARSRGGGVASGRLLLLQMLQMLLSQ